MSSPGPIRILLAGGYAVMRSGLRAFLAAYPDLCVVGEAQDGAEAEHLCGTVQPDIVLLDEHLPDDGTLAQRLRAGCAHSRVITLVGDGDGAQAGARVCLSKNLSAEELANVIRQAHHGWQGARSGAEAAPRPPQAQVLTARERQVLALMSEGLHNNEIAKRLIISPATVKFHVSSILAKLGAATRTEAVAIAVERHLASPHREPRA